MINKLPEKRTWYTVENNEVVSYVGTLEDTLNHIFPSYYYREQALEYLAAIQYMGWVQVEERQKKAHENDLQKVA